MKHILIPTDLSVRSLNSINAVVSHHEKETPLRITLFHLLKTPVSFSELLLRNSKYKYYEAISEDFQEACNVLRNKYSSAIHSMSVQFGFGETAVYLKNYLDSQRIDMVAMGKDIALGLPFKNSADIMQLLKKVDVQYFSRHKINYSDMNVLNMSELRISGEHQNDLEYAKAK
jgi:hypothetical protein